MITFEHFSAFFCFADVLASTQVRLHTDLPQLLASQAATREHVQRSASGHAEVQLGVRSEAHDPLRHHVLHSVHGLVCHSAHSTRREQAHVAVRVLLVHRGHVLDRGLRRHLPGRLALTAVHDRSHNRCSHSLANSIRTAGRDLHGEAEERQVLLKAASRE